MTVKLHLRRWGFSKDFGFLGRFGGGWKFSLGIRTSGRVILIDLIIGSISIELWQPKEPTP